MAHETREWADIDRAWLKNYLQGHNVASGYDLDDELLGSQVSWILTADEWAKLRGAWEKERVGAERGDSEPDQEADERSAATEAQPELATLVPSEEENQAPAAESLVVRATEEPAAEPRVPDAERDRWLDEKRRMNELLQTALSDWGDFKELFRNCPDSAAVGEWELLADTPLALFQKAAKLTALDEAKSEEQRQVQEQAFEGEVARAQNIIAGYFIYCRKHRITPTLEHLLDFIPELRSGHSPEAVREAWKRDAE